MQHLEHLKLSLLEETFPTNALRRAPWASQREMFRIVSENGSVTIESPTGSGKTAVEYTVLKAADLKRKQPLFLITPNKTLVAQIHQEFPDLKVALGRSEHQCHYFKDTLPADKQPMADEIPCSLLKDCPHRVDQATGKTFVEGAIPCPYLKQKFEAKQGGIVLSTMAFYLFTQLFSREWEQPEVLVIDEAHRMAEVVRNALSYEITDWHLRKSVELLREIGAEEAELLNDFYKKLVHVIKSKPAHQKTVLNAREVGALMEKLEVIDQSGLLRKLEKAVREKVIDVVEKRETLKKLEVVVKDLRRYLRSFEYSLPDKCRHALNYTYAYYKEEKGEKEHVQYRLVVKCYYVAPIIQKIMGKTTVALSATIGDPDVFGHETGIRNPVFSLESNFPSDNARLFMPTNTANLAVNERSNRDLPKSIRMVARASKRLADKGIRSLFVTISNLERDKFMMMANEEGLKAISYGNGVTAKEAAVRFRDGEGDVLCGTASNYAEGVDLPKQIAPVIFFLRPGYPNPTDPGTQFEEERFGGSRWALWNWRVMIQALQVRGRNIRSTKDLGVTIFMSQQFRRFVHASLPKWLEKAYVNDRTFDECISQAEELLGKQ